MKSFLATILAFETALLPLMAADHPSLPDKKARESYSVGVSIGRSWRQQDMEFDSDVVLRGIKDALSGSKTLLSDSEMQEVLNAYRTEHTLRREEKRKQLGEKNRSDGAKFLAENKTKPGVTTLPDGLEYKVITTGNGTTPGSNDSVTVNYRGTLIDGTEFDSSFKRNQPATFSLNGVIKGWTEALQKMKAGSKWQLFVPPALAYGERGFGPQIGPNATLIFEIELLSVVPAPPVPQPVVSDIIKVPSEEGLKKGEKIEIIKPDQIPKK